MAEKDIKKAAEQAKDKEKELKDKTEDSQYRGQKTKDDIQKTFE
ncbi:glycopeptide resistance-associated protein GraF [Staphylococcus pseudintermedius]|nr:glycopeptide resistance-associated protein GraF [Staphylococcus pseudintermedius]